MGKNGFLATSKNISQARILLGLTVSGLSGEGRTENESLELSLLLVY
jgi:hypothetical protein